MDIPMSLTALSQAFNISKTLFDIRDATVLNTKVIELQRAILDAQEQALTVQEARLELIKKIRELEEKCSKLQGIEGLEWEKPYYWLGKEGTKDGPFCQCCYDTKKELIRLQDIKNGTWFCLSCKSKVRDQNYLPPQYRVVGRTGNGSSWMGR